MFKWISSLYKFISRSKTKRNQNRRSLTDSMPHSETRTLYSSLDKNRQVLEEIFNRCDDLVLREVSIGKKDPAIALVVYLDPLVNLDLLQRGLINALLSVGPVPKSGVTTAWLKEKVIPLGDVWEKRLMVEVANDIAKGIVGVFVDGQDRALLLNIYEKTHRTISEPTTETVVRGPSDAFNEDLRTNIGLLRKRLHTTRLAVENLAIGEISSTEISIVYLKGYVTENLVEEIKTRLKRLKIDAVIGSGQIEEFIQDNPYSPFSTIETTERPDKLYGNLLEGSVGLLFNNTPFALIIPSTLTGQMQSPEDYYSRYWFSSFIRFLRWVGLAFALILPAFYIAVTTFHQELVPTPLLMSIVSSREGVPFPGFLEALIMELTFEILREAGIRLPRPFGQTISIVGAIVVGQAAVNASLVSPAMVVVVALTAISTYTIPSISISNSIRILRFPFMVAAAFMGLFGVMAGLSALTFHLCSLRSFGVPYLSPIAPVSFGDLKDTFIRVPAWMMHLRPRLIGYVEPQRQHGDLKPHPPAPRDGRSRQRKGGGR